MASRSMKILLYEPLLRFDSLLPAHGLATKGKASGIKPRKTRNQKKALYNRRPLASTSTALPLPAIPQIPFSVVSWRIQPPVHPLKSPTPQLYLLYPPHPTGHTAWSITSTISPFQIPPIYHPVHLPALPRSSQGTSQLGTFDR